MRLFYKKHIENIKNQFDLTFQLDDKSLFYNRLYGLQDYIKATEDIHSHLYTPPFIRKHYIEVLEHYQEVAERGI